MATVNFHDALDKTATLLHKTYNNEGMPFYVPIVLRNCQYLIQDAKRFVDASGNETKQYSRRCIVGGTDADLVAALDLDGDYIVLGAMTSASYSRDDVQALTGELFKIENIMDRRIDGISIYHGVLSKYVRCIALEGDRSGA